MDSGNWPLQRRVGMQLGSKARYSVRALAVLALHSEAGCVPLFEIAERTNVSLSYLEQLFASLRRGGVVLSVRGPGGGYKLSRPPEMITLASIFACVGELTEGDRGEGEYADDRLWSSLYSEVRTILEHWTLADVLKEMNNPGVVPTRGLA